MRAIEPEFTSKGFTFKLLKRSGMVCLFAKTHPEIRDEKFEVVVLNVFPEMERYGKLLPEREAMPPSESWGKSGWSFSDRQAAEKRYLKECVE